MAECVARAHPSEVPGPDGGAPLKDHATLCVLAPGRVTETGINVTGKQDLVVTAAAGGAAVFDATDEVSGRLKWEPHPEREGVLSSSLLELESSGEIGDMQPSAWVIDGVNIVASDDYMTINQPCFEYDARQGEDAMPRPFSCKYADRYFNAAAVGFEGSTDIPEDFTPPRHWMQNDPPMLHVKADAGAVPHVRVLNQTRSVAFTASEGSPARRVEFRGLHFLGSMVKLRGPADGRVSSLLAVAGCRFLFNQGKIELESTKKRGRGAGDPVLFTDNVVEFGQSAVWYVASGAEVKRNLMVGNALGADKPYYVFHAIAHSDNLEDNTALYEGANGGHLAFAEGYRARNNLWVGTSFLSNWHDNAVHHVFTGSQTNLVVEDSWFLGPSKVKSIRLDTAKSTTEPGRHSTMRGNVFLGHEPLTIKGDEHIFEHNTGDKATMVEAWASLGNQNNKTWFRYNAVETWGTRGSTSAAGPGYAALNACTNLPVCNSQIVDPDGNLKAAADPEWATSQFQPGGPKQIFASAGGLVSGICGLLKQCFREEAGETGLQWTNEWLAQFYLLSGGSMTPEQARVLSYAQIRELDFTPSGDELSIACDAGADCSGTGQVEGGFGDAAKLPEKRADYVGAYRKGSAPKVPGCFPGCRRPPFPIPASEQGAGPPPPGGAGGKEAAAKKAAAKKAAGTDSGAGAAAGGRGALLGAAALLLLLLVE